MADHDDTRDDNPWTQRGFVAAAIVVGIIALLAVLIIAGSDGNPPSPTVGERSQAPNERARSSDEGGCRLPAGPQTVPTATPIDTKWELVGTMAAPGARNYGPVASEPRSCFAQSPMGALYAAVNFWASSTARPTADVLADLAADTAVLPDAIADAQNQGADVRLDDAAGALQVAGFRFSSYEQDVASISVAFRLENGALVQLPMTLRWEAGDWKYVVPPSGDPGLSRLEGLSDYVPWSGA